MLRPRSLSGLLRPSRRRASRRRPPRPVAHAACERLEHRALLTAFVVNSLADTPPIPDGQLTLREALEAANTNAPSGDAAAGSADGDTITFAPALAGTIALTQGQLQILDDVSIDGGGNVTVEGGFNRVFFVDTGGGGAGAAFDVVLSRLTVARGITAGGPAGFIAGGIHVTAGDGVTLNAVTVTGNGRGGIFNAGSLLVIGCVVSDNAGNVGGGIFNAAGATAVIANTSITGNSAGGGGADDGGGGIFNDGGTVTIRDSLIGGNDATGLLGSGGGIFNNGGNLTAIRTTVRGNISKRAGAGIENVAGRVVFDGCLLELNRAGGAVIGPGNGGGLHVRGPGAETIVFRTRVRSNFADLEGGGLWNAVGSRLTVDRSTISGNIAAGAAADDGGGGIFDNGGTVVVVGSFIVDNDARGASGRGGGVFLGAGGTVDIVRSVIARNDAAGNGGGVFNDADADFALTQISDNVAGDGGGVFTDAGAVSDVDLERVFANLPNNFAGPGAVV